MRCRLCGVSHCLPPRSLWALLLLRPVHGARSLSGLVRARPGVRRKGGSRRREAEERRLARPAPGRGRSRSRGGGGVGPAWVCGAGAAGAHGSVVSPQRPEHEQPHGAAARALPPAALPGGAVSRRRSGRAVLGARGGGAGHAAQRPTAWSSRAEPAPLPSHPSPWGPCRLALSPESWWLFPQHLLPPFPPLPLPSPQAAPQQQSRTPSSASLHVSRVHPTSSSLAHPKDPLLSPALTWPTLTWLTLTWPHPHLAHPFWPALPGQLLHKPAAASIPAPRPAGSRAPL